MASSGGPSSIFGTLCQAMDRACKSTKSCLSDYSSYVIQFQRLERRNDRPLNSTMRVHGTNHPSPLLSPDAREATALRLRLKGSKPPYPTSSSPIASATKVQLCPMSHPHAFVGIVGLPPLPVQTLYRIQAVRYQMHHSKFVSHIEFQL